MKNKLILLLALSAISIYFVTDTNALMCYECNSLIDLECSNLNRMSIHYHLCAPPQTINNTLIEYRRPLCRKMIQKIKVRNNLIVQKHSCGWELYKNSEEDICYESRYDDYEEIVCQCFSDACNLSNPKAANSALVSTFSILSLLILYFNSK